MRASALKGTKHMDRLNHGQNIQRYRKLLERVTDETQRVTLLNLLADKEAKLAGKALPGPDAR